MERRGLLIPSFEGQRSLRISVSFTVGTYSNLIDVPGLFRVVDVGAKEVDAVKPLLRDLPDIIVGTPGRLAQHLKYVRCMQCWGSGSACF